MFKNHLKLGKLSLKTCRRDSFISIGVSIFFFLMFSIARSLYGDAGDLDPAFNGTGKVTTDFFSTNDWASNLAIQSDGKIIAVGAAKAVDNLDFAIVRYNPDGSLDLTFDSDGKITVDFGLGANDEAQAVAVQPDGNIVVAGYAAGGSNCDFALARFDTNGQLDTTFDADGKVTTDFASGCDYIEDILLQSDGKVLAVGTASAGISGDFALARYNPNGSLDTTFSADGKLTTDFGSAADAARSLILQPDGKIVAVGVGGNVDNFDFAVARYHHDGILDSSFDEDGKVLTDLGSSSDYAGDAALQSDGKILASGTSSLPTSLNDFALVRYNVNGSLDLTFDQDGKVTTDFNLSEDNARAIAMQLDGKILVSGTTDNPVSFEDLALARYNSNGSLDNGFGSNGKVTTDFNSSSDFAADISVQTDGKIIIAGGSTSNGVDSDFALARYESDLPVSYMFFDDFNDGILATNWTYPKGAWSESIGVVTSSPLKKAQAVASPAFLGCDVCTLQARMRTSGGIGNRVWLIGWYVDTNNYIELLMNEERDRWILKQRVGKSVVAKAKGLQVIQPNTDYDVKVSFDGTNFQVTIGGQLLIAMPKFAASTPTGTIGFQIKGTTGTFDFVIIY